MSTTSASERRRGGGIHLFDIAGIQIRIDYSWFIIFVLVVWSLSAGYLPVEYPGESTAAYWLAGLVATLLFFVSILVHELAHSFMAMRSGITIPDITLFIFGGVSRLTEESKDPRTELKVAAVGPLASFAIAGLFWVVGTRLDAAPQLLRAVVSYLTFINVALGIFNLVPGFPLDGGRILRAILWWRSGSLVSATRATSDIGKGFAVFLMILGGLQIFYGGLLGGLWLIFIGMFLRGMADAGYQELLVRKSLEGMKVEDLELDEPVEVPPDMTVQELVDDYFLRYGRHSFPVVEKENLIGVVTLSGVQKIAEAKRDSTTIRHVMTALDDDSIVQSESSVEDILGRFRGGARRLVVMDENQRLKGMISQNELQRLLEVHRALA